MDVIQKLPPQPQRPIKPILSQPKETVRTVCRSLEPELESLPPFKDVRKDNTETVVSKPEIRDLIDLYSEPPTASESRYTAEIGDSNSEEGEAEHQESHHTPLKKKMM